MSALVEQPVQDPQGGGPVQGQNANPNSGNSLLQMTAGPAALAMRMIFEALALYAYVIGLQAKQKKNMIEAENIAAQAQAAETIAEGKAAFDYALAEGLTTIGMAALSAGVMFGGLAYGSRGANKDMTDLQKETVPMNEMEKSLSKPSSDLTTGNKLPEDQEREILARMGQFREGDYSKGADDPAVTKEAIGRLKNGRTEEDKVYNYEEKFDARFRERQDQNTRKALAIENRKSTVAQTISVLSQATTAIGTGASAAIRGAKEQVLAQHRAAAGLDGNSAQVVQQEVAAAAQAMTKGYDAEIQEVQTLKEIDRANSVNG